MILGDKKLKATTGFVLIESDEHESSESVTKGGIILLHKEKHNVWVKGTIHSAGKFARYGDNHKVIGIENAPVKEGDVILYRKYEGQRIAFSDKILYRLPYERVRVVVEEEVDN
jgi:co-chaperonin GroES (HSP10)